jgi:hypothetical protein
MEEDEGGSGSGDAAAASVGLAPGATPILHAAAAAPPAVPSDPHRWPDAAPATPTGAQPNWLLPG